MKKMCGFIKEHKFCSLVMAPLVLFLAFLVLGWPMMFLTGFSYHSAGSGHSSDPIYYLQM